MWDDGFFLQPSAIVAPEGYVGINGGPTAHMTIEAAEGEPRECGSPRREVALEGRRAVVMHCSDLDGLLAEHVLLRWTEEGITHDVSLHGQSAANIGTLVEVGLGIELTAPG